MKRYFLILVVVLLANVVHAQPAVRNEPRHHNVFENDYVRVLDAYLAPYDTTQYHVHSTPSVFIPFTETATGSQILGQPPIRSVSVAGQLWYDSLVTPRIHRVWNEDTGWFHVMDVELTAGIAKSNEPVLQSTALRLLFDKPLVRVYDVQLAGHADLEISSSKTGYLLVSLGDADISLKSGTSIQHRWMKAGHYCWIGAGLQSRLTCNGSSDFLLLQLK